MFNRKRYIILFLLSATHHSVFSQITIPITFHENKYILFRLPGLSDKDSLTFFFDTGASTTLLDKTIAQKLGMKANIQRTVPGASGSKTYDVATGQKIYLQKKISINNINIVMEDLTRLNGAVGQKFDGIIGNDLLKNYLAVVDISARKMLFYPFGTKLDLKGYTPVQFNFNNGIQIPQFPLSITLENGEKLTGSILFDSGAGISLMINSPFQKQYQLMGKVGKTLSSSQNNLSNKAATTLALMKGMEFDAFQFDERILVNISSNISGASAFENYLGILGSEVIYRFDMIIDYSNRVLYLKPNDLFAAKFETAVSPVKLGLADGKVVITNVLEQSKAYACGLREGYRIISINGKKDLTISQYRKMLLNELAKVDVVYMDDKQNIKSCKFEIEKLF